MGNILFYFVAMCMIWSTFALLDPITIGGVATVLAWWKYDFLKENTYCRLNECCDDRSIPGNMYELQIRLQDLFGQHIVKSQLIPALKSHLRNTRNSNKPLVISFHGTPGTGKNMVADMIANSVYTNGLQSQFVHKFMGRADFARNEEPYRYRTFIYEKVSKALRDCPRSLFIFDEVDKMPVGAFESLTSIVDYKGIVNRVDFSRAIFIFLSNTAGVEISKHLGNLMKEGVRREDTKMSNFEPTLEKAAYNMDGGLKKSSLIEAHTIDHFIPFLPLEKSHIYQCLRAEFKRYGVGPKEETLNKIANNVITYDPAYNIFVTSGCKKLDKKVAVAVYNMNL
uniref:Torsin-1A C-terminal domain-containing protein n=1 Tax=Glossina brevipalpis TaxID=37001 RepID=A0A1A9WIN6_9MUSC